MKKEVVLTITYEDSQEMHACSDNLLGGEIAARDSRFDTYQVPAWLIHKWSHPCTEILLLCGSKGMLCGLTGKVQRKNRYSSVLTPPSTRKQNKVVHFRYWEGFKGPSLFWKNVTTGKRLSCITCLTSTHSDSLLAATVTTCGGMSSPYA